MRNKKEKTVTYWDLGSKFIKNFLDDGDYEAFKTKVQPALFCQKAGQALGFALDEMLSERFLVAYLDYLEQTMAALIGKYSCHELLYWTRRIAPLSVYDRNSLTVRLYREVLNLAIMKYGALDNRFYADEQLGMFPLMLKEIGEWDKPTLVVKRAIADAFYLESLCCLYVYVTQRIRIVRKGGWLVPDDEWGIDADAGPELRSLIELYDNRIQYDHLLSNTGTYYDKSTKQPDDVVLIYQLNADHVQRMPFDFKDAESSFASNYMPALLNFKHFTEYVMLFKDEIQAQFGFPAEVFLSMLAAISEMNLTRLAGNNQYRYMILQRAYMFIPDKESFLHDLAKQSKKQHEKRFGPAPEPFADLTAAVFQYLTCEPASPRDIDLWTRGPRKLYFPLDEAQGIFDFSGLQFVMSSFMLPISRTDGHTANKRSLHFENQTIEAIRSQLPEAVPWVAQRRIFARQHDASKEIDASFVLKHILFIVECKSVNVSFTFDMGDVKALQFRQRRNEDALRQADEKAQFLVRYRDELSVPLPPDIKAIVPLVVSPFAEYIWTEDDSLFLMDQLPRILTIDELALLAQKDPIDALLQKPFCCRL